MCVCVYPQFHAFIYGCAGSPPLLKLSLVVTGGYSRVPGRRLPFVVDSLVVPGSRARRLQSLWPPGSRHRLSSCGSWPQWPRDMGLPRWGPCLLPWQAEPLPPRYQGSLLACCSDITKTREQVLPTAFQSSLQMRGNSCLQIQK